MRVPTVGSALGSAIRAVAGESWLVVAGMAVLLLQGVLALPATVFATAVSGLALRTVLVQGGGPDQAIAALAQAWSSPRARSIAIGLWLASTLLLGALRALWVSGAAPVLAWRLSGFPGPRPAFREGAAWRFGAVLPTAAVALVLDLLAGGMLVASILGVAVIGHRVHEVAGAAAFVSAAGIAAAAFLGASLSVVGDVAVARAAISGEGPGQAVSRAFRSFLARPPAYVAALLAIAVGSVVAASTAEGVVGGFLAVAPGGPGLLLLVPQGMLAVLGATVAAGTELWRLAAVGVLALSDQAERENRWTSFRSESLGMRPPSQ